MTAPNSANGTVSRPRVALVAHDIHSGGGAPRVTFEVLRRGLDRYRFTVYSATLAPELRNRVEWRRVRVPARPFPLRYASFFLLTGIRLRRRRYDLVHTVGPIVPGRVDVCSVHFSHTGFQAANGSLAPADLPLLRRLNTSISNALGMLFERWMYGCGRVGTLAAVSHGLGRELRRQHGRVRVAVIPNGVDLERLRRSTETRTELRSAEGVDADDVVLLFVGGDWNRKGLPLMVKALALARDQTSSRLLLWVVGDGDRKAVEALAAELGVRDQLRLFGFRNDTERFYQAADIALLLSVYEAYPLASLEAAAAGLPQIATRVSGVEDLVGDDEAGILVERTSDSVADAIVRLASDPSLRMRLGARAEQRVSTHTWERTAAETYEVYGRMIRTGGRS